MNHQIDSLAYTNRLRGLPPSHKLSFAIALLILSLVSGAIVQLSIGLWLAVWIVVYAGIPGKLYLRLLSLPLMFLLTSLPALAMGAVAGDRIPAIQWDIWQGWGISIGTFYLYVSRTGIYQVSLLFARAFASTSCMYFILLTVPFTEILQILRQLRCPELVTELLLLMYRFIFSLLAIADELKINRYISNSSSVTNSGQRNCLRICKISVNGTVKRMKYIQLVDAKARANNKLTWYIPVRLTYR